MTQGVRVTTGARLHFGLLARNSQLSRQHGGIGVMVEDPASTVRMRIAERDVIHGEMDTERIADWLQRCRREWPSLPSGVRVDLPERLPSHRGFGSGTQLAFGVASGLLHLGGVAADPEQLAIVLGRGQRSAIGLHGFFRGGWLVDGGVVDETTPAPLLARHDCPSDWRFVLVTPPHETGCSGEGERSAFAKLPPMPVAQTAELARLLLLNILPGIANRDAEATRSGIADYGANVGESFRRVQGGVFRSERMRHLTALLEREGLTGFAQTSWGPTIVRLCGNASEASLVTDAVLDIDPDCEVICTPGRNVGATIQPE